MSKRASKHIEELVELRQQGARVVLLFAVLHEGIQRVTAASHIDPVYASTLGEAVDAGLEVLAYKANISLEQMVLGASLPVCL